MQVAPKNTSLTIKLAGHQPSAQQSTARRDGIEQRKLHHDLRHPIDVRCHDLVSAVAAQVAVARKSASFSVTFRKGCFSSATVNEADMCYTHRPVLKQ
jgi:hypothetical protein